MLPRGTPAPCVERSRCSLPHPACARASAAEPKQSIPGHQWTRQTACHLLTLCVLQCPGPGRPQHPSDGCLQAWAGAGQSWFHTTITPGSPGSTWPTGPDLPPTTHRVPRVDLVSAECAPHTLLSTLHSPSPAGQHPLCPPHPAQGPQGALGRARSRGCSRHPPCPGLAALQAGAESDISCSG